MGKNNVHKSDGIDFSGHVPIESMILFNNEVYYVNCQ